MHKYLVATYGRARPSPSIITVAPSHAQPDAALARRHARSHRYKLMWQGMWKLKLVVSCIFIDTLEERYDA
jgi:hypothetical protein